VGREEPTRIGKQNNILVYHVSVAVEWLAPLLHIPEVPEPHDRMVGNPASCARGSSVFFLVLPNAGMSPCI
jgi:hypothetical protein